MVALQHFRFIFKSIKKHFHWVEQQTGVNGAQLWALAAVVDEPGGVRLVKRAPKPLQGVLPDALRRLTATELAQLNLPLSAVGGKMKVRDASGKATPLADI